MNLYNLSFRMVFLLYGILIKWALMEAVGWWMACRCDDCKPFWSWVEIPTRKQIFFSLIFVRIHTNEFIQLLYKSCSTNSYKVWFLYQFIHFLYELYSTNSYNEPRARAARAKPEQRGRSPSTPPAPTRPHPAAPTLGYTRLPRR
jgi:hypothetical protein